MGLSNKSSLSALFLLALWPQQASGWSHLLPRHGNPHGGPRLRLPSRAVGNNFHHRTLTSNLWFLPNAKQSHGSSSYLNSSPLIASHPSSSALENTEEPLISSPFLVDEIDEHDTSTILNYLPQQGNHLPLRLRQLVARATRQYQRGALVVGSTSLILDLIDTIDVEYKTRKNRSLVCNGTKLEIVSDAEQLAVEIVSLCALYQLPMEITQVFLRQLMALYPHKEKDDDDDSVLNESNTTTTSNLREFVQSFTAWNETVQFPKGLAVRPKAASSWRRRWTNRRQAQTLIQTAAQQTPPPNRPRTALLVLPQTTNAETNNNNNMETNHRIPLYFPGSRRRQFWDSTRARIHKLYLTVKAQGRAGFLGYCVFNFLLYSIGMMMQWNTVVSSSSSSMMRKYAKLFGILYGVSQLLKIPKLLFSVGVAPYIRKFMKYLNVRFGWSEDTSTIVIVGVLIVMFGVAAGIPLLHEYHSNVGMVVFPMVDTVQPV